MGNINVDAIKNEVIRYGNANPMALTPAVLSQNILLNQLAKPLAKVKGNWSFPSILMTNLLQAFSDTWTAYGSAQFANKTAKNYHLKVNLGINPYDVYGSWAEELYEEDKKPNEMPISKYIVNMINDKITSELATASIVSVYDPAQKGNANPDLTKIMNGLNAVVSGIVADTTNPAFLIPLDAALNSDPVAKVNTFERSLPQGNNVKAILVPLELFFDYIEARETPANEVIDYNAGYRRKTKYGRDLIGVPGLTKMVAWVDGNLFRLYDRKDNPAQIDDVQVQDYLMKIFIQFHLGYDFAVNQYVFVETQDAQKKRGLNNANQNKLYYPNELNLTV